VLLLLLAFTKQPCHIAGLGYLGKINFGLDLRGRGLFPCTGSSAFGGKMPPDLLSLVRLNRA
jgi:hypothetical protein